MTCDENGSIGLERHLNGILQGWNFGFGRGNNRAQQRSNGKKKGMQETGWSENPRLLGRKGGYFFSFGFPRNDTILDLWFLLFSVLYQGSFLQDVCFYSLSASRDDKLGHVGEMTERIHGILLGIDVYVASHGSCKPLPLLSFGDEMNRFINGMGRGKKVQLRLTTDTDCLLAEVDRRPLTCGISKSRSPVCSHSSPCRFLPPALLQRLPQTKLQIGSVDVDWYSNLTASFIDK